MDKKKIVYSILILAAVLIGVFSLKQYGKGFFVPQQINLIEDDWADLASIFLNKDSDPDAYQQGMADFIGSFTNSWMRKVELVAYLTLFLVGIYVIAIISNWIICLISSILMLLFFLFFCIGINDIGVLLDLPMGLMTFVIFILTPFFIFFMDKAKVKMEISKQITEKNYTKLQSRYNKLNEGHQKTTERLQDLEKKVSKISSSFVAFRGLAREISSCLEVKKAVEILVDVMVKLLKARKGEIFLFDDTRNKLDFITGFGLQDVNQYKGVSIALGESVIGWAAQNGKIFSKFESQGDYRISTIPSHPMFKSLIVAPLKMGKDLVGVINIEDLSEKPSSEDLRNLDAFSSLGALAISNARLFEHIREMADIDNLTRLYVNRYFQEHGSDELKRASRYGEIFSVVMTDIDHFKNFNDTYGHQVGDFVLKETARILINSVRDGIDLPARYGGEEFIVLLPKTDTEGAYIFAERVRKQVAESKYIFDDVKTGEKLELGVTISLGVATFPEHGSDLKSLIKKADDALYQAKESGRNKTCLATA
jgi:diguanylate cyclase (GGDEF)-like protein